MTKVNESICLRKIKNDEFYWRLVVVGEKKKEIVKIEVEFKGEGPIKMQ